MLWCCCYDQIKSGRLKDEEKQKRRLIRYLYPWAPVEELEGKSDPSMRIRKEIKAHENPMDNGAMFALSKGEKRSQRGGI